MSKLTDLISLDVSGKIETKNKMKYLSWAFAWAEFLKIHPDATYEIERDSDNIPVFGNKTIGYTCYTSVTADNITRKMWLPVMDGANKPMKDECYEYQTKYGKKKVEAITMFDINKTVMRCLTKNLAMFGLGLYIYAGEDVPEIVEDQEEIELELVRLKSECKRLIEACGQDFDKVKNSFKFNFEFGTVQQLSNLEQILINKVNKIEEDKRNDQ